MLGWFRRWIGRTYLAELTELARDLRDAQVRIEGLQLVVDYGLAEPAPGEGCTKVRLWDETEAEAFARKVERESGQPARSLKSYRCRICPPQPLTPARYWHVGHVREGERGDKGRRKRAGRKRLPTAPLTQTPKPSDIAKLRQKAGT